MVGRLTPSVLAISGTGSPLARIRSARAIFSGASLRGLPVSGSRRRAATSGRSRGRLPVLVVDRVLP
jgi:hypothetical protein